MQLVKDPKKEMDFVLRYAKEYRDWVNDYVSGINNDHDKKVVNKYLIFTYQGELIRRYATTEITEGEKNENNK